MTQKHRLFAPAFAAPVLFLPACCACPAFARAALNAASIPAMSALHRLTARIPFPVAEPLALLLTGVAFWALLRAGFRACRSRCLRPLRGWLRALACAALTVVGAFALLWAPACAQPIAAVPETGDARLAMLCDALIGALNDAPLAFSGPSDILARAAEAADMPGCTVKAARYPEWMALSRAWGLFVPLTGEALVDAAEPAPLLPFTAVHELMHLSGIADEGAANIAAWNHCLEAGGPFTDSARLWALRYAMGLLRCRDEAAWRRTAQKMKDALARVYAACGGDIEPRRPRRISLIRGDYAALVGYLAG